MTIENLTTGVLIGLIGCLPVVLYGVYNWIYTRGYCAALGWATKQQLARHV